MRHLNDKIRLGRNTAHRAAMMRNMVTSLIEEGRIQTTVAKGRQLKRLADRMVTLGKEGTLHARRRALSVVRKKTAVSKLFVDLANRFKDRNGGYTRLLKLGFRAGDGAPMALVEYVDHDPQAKLLSRKKKNVKSKSQESSS